MKKYFSSSDAADDSLFLRTAPTYAPKVDEKKRFDPFREINEKNAILASAKASNASYSHDPTQVLVRLAKKQATDGMPKDGKQASREVNVQALIESAFS